MIKTVAIVFLGISVLAFLTYAADKRKATKRRFRISERYLLMLGFFGGAIGALAAMLLLRHKTRHWYFWFVNFTGALWQMCVLYFLATLPV